MKIKTGNKISTRLIALLLFIVSGGGPLAAQSPAGQAAFSADEYARAIYKSQTLIDSMMDSQNIPGVEIAVSVEGQRVWSQGFGFAGLEQKVPVWLATKMRIGSVSKSLTSVALGVLIEQGQLDIDAPIRKYVPYFPQKEYTITTRQVAGHLAGIRHYRGDEFLSAKHYESVKSGLQIFMNDSLLSKPGEKYEYSTYGWNLISAVIEGASGQSYLKFMEENVLKPLGMHETVADYNKPIISHRTEFYTLDDNQQVINAPFVDNSYKWAGGGYLGTARDLLKFGNALLGDEYLEPETVDLLWEAQTTNDGEKTDYGMGWLSGTDNQGRYWVGHSGGSVGGTTQFVILPKKEVVVAILSNLSEVDYNDIQLKIAGLFIMNKP